ncbi:hypothetical protein PV797_19110 [Clostridiaceae bacterium M8S5]|nr:hypothetical protein PV797_19110 [Clostridiaceae bacterium M8S5]
MIENKVFQNILLLRDKLLYVDSQIKYNIASIIIDGSIIRGDFIADSSDIDITITTFGNNITFNIKKLIEDIIVDVANDLPKREYPRKPLVYDIQWQDIQTLNKCKNRTLDEWTVDNVPNGYPKLWLYAFDSIAHHNVLYGQDVTDFYTRIKPKHFVPIRMKRIYDSTIKIKDTVSDYEKLSGGITQIKNAWEVIRCTCLAYGLMSIKKDDVYTACKAYFTDKSDRDLIDDLYNFYINKNNNLLTGNYRKELCDFTIRTIKYYNLIKTV